MNRQIDYVLARERWKLIKVIENHEPLVELHETERIKIYKDPRGIRTDKVYLRKFTASRVLDVPSFLPGGFGLLIYEGWRSTESQRKDWATCYVSLKNSQPDLSHAELERQTGLFVARPLPLANHHCGGAVDLTLTYNGQAVDMGTPTGYEIMESASLFRSKIPMFSDSITETQIRFRRMLRGAMEKAGFVWYPGEWWHYCFGDRMWAVYTGRTECMYGPIEL